MSENTRLSDNEYEKLNLEYENSPPKLSGNPGFLKTHNKNYIEQSEFVEPSREPYDYTEWQRDLFKDVPLEKFLQDAQNYRDSMDKQ